MIYGLSTDGLKPVVGWMRNRVGESKRSLRVRIGDIGTIQNIALTCKKAPRVRFELTRPLRVTSFPGVRSRLAPYR